MPIKGHLEGWAQRIRPPQPQRGGGGGGDGQGLQSGECEPRAKTGVPFSETIKPGYLKVAQRHVCEPAAAPSPAVLPPLSPKSRCKPAGTDPPTTDTSPPSGTADIAPRASAMAPVYCGERAVQTKLSASSRYRSFRTFPAFARSASSTTSTAIFGRAFSASGACSPFRLLALCLLSLYAYSPSALPQDLSTPVCREGLNASAQLAVRCTARRTHACSLWRELGMTRTVVVLATKHVEEVAHGKEGVVAPRARCARAGQRRQVRPDQRRRGESVEVIPRNCRGRA